MTHGSGKANIPKLDDLLVQAQIRFDDGRYEEARELLLIFLKEKPGAAVALRSLGLVSTRLGLPAQAIRYCLEAVRADPLDSESHFSLALLYLLHGNYEQGLVEYEWRLTRDHCVARGYTQGAALWDGRPLEEEGLMLHCEQGFGDNLQFIRFLPQLRERVKKIYLACHPELVRLFSKLEGLAGVFTEKQSLPGYQFHCPLLSLPHRFHLTFDKIPSQVPYLPTSQTSHLSSGKRRVGLVWRASQASANGLYKSVSLEALRPLAHLPFHWVSLQKDPNEAEREILHTVFHAEEQGSTFRDFQDTADSLETLDLLLTVDTSVAHLAGALGRPTWLLLPKWPDWRWLLDRTENPWYPTMTLFRQRTDRDWTEVIATIRSRLEGLPRLEGPS